ncbi:hydrolase [Oceanobacillus chungangensis]|uniref:Hydrolase n=1 Tax=Oceanobacillus chungangensis TaxID=1229152 RepID=A0A3D8PXV5_9BACI|nr:hydrolase [Oceanobacillus chungangensis]RDW20986.1 hydrolase [Oceanobacillus chungangensis]
MEKNTYFINIGTGEISQIKNENNFALIIQATAEEVNQLRRKMDDMHDSSFDSFIRAQIPFLEYHHDQANEQYDKNLTEAYQLIHQLGNSQTKAHIESMGIFLENQE